MDLLKEYECILKKPELKQEMRNAVHWRNGNELAAHFTYSTMTRRYNRGEPLYELGSNRPVAYGCRSSLIEIYVTLQEPLEDPQCVDRLTMDGMTYDVHFGEYEYTHYTTSDGEFPTHAYTFYA